MNSHTNRLDWKLKEVNLNLDTYHLIRNPGVKDETTPQTRVRIYDKVYINRVFY